MSLQTPFKRLRRASFTLVELLAAITVLSVMMLGLATITGFVTTAWVNGIGAADNFSKARVMLSLLDRDMQMMVLRPDVAVFVDNNANASCTFYTKVQAYPGTDTRALSIVQYSLTNSATLSILQRNTYGVSFPVGSIPYSATTTTQTTPFTGITAAMPALTNTTTLANLQTENLSTGVIAFQWQWVDRTGTIRTPAGSGTTATNYFSYNFTTPSTNSNPCMIVVSMVVLSNNAYNIANQLGNQLGPTGTLATIFSTNAPTNPTSQTYSQVWNSVLASPTPAYLALPLPLRTGIQVFERHISLPMTPSSS